MLTTVFQAEITAINMASITPLDNLPHNKMINFYIDSKSAIMALDSYTVYNKCVAEAKRMLNKLAEFNNTVNLNWIPNPYTSSLSVQGW